MRLIDADALKEVLKDPPLYASLGGMTMEGVFMLIDNEAPTIDAVPSWIPCEERLPEQTQEVLVTGINGCVYTSRIVHGEFEYGGNVIAWMPLPKPYEGERKDDE